MGAEVQPHTLSIAEIYQTASNIIRLAGVSPNPKSIVYSLNQHSRLALYRYHTSPSHNPSNDQIMVNRPISPLPHGRLLHNL